MGSTVVLGATVRYGTVLSCLVYGWGLSRFSFGFKKEGVCVVVVVVVLDVPWRVTCSM